MTDPTRITEADFPEVRGQRRASAPLASPDRGAPEAARHGVGSALREGTVAGLIGYAAVALVVGILDIAGGRSVLHTPAALGSWLMGVRIDPTASWPNAGPVLAYNALHLLLSLLVGTMGAFALRTVERFPWAWYAALMVSVAFTIYLVGPVGGLLEQARVVDSPTVITATATWLIAMSAYLWRFHRSLRRRVKADLDSEG